MAHEIREGEGSQRAEREHPGGQANTYKCEKCGQSFHSENEKRDHQRTAHPTEHQPGEPRR